MPDATTVVIEVIGEGRTDIGAPSDVPGLADRGIVPILLRKLCGDPPSLRVKTKQIALLARKTLEQKVKFAKLQASYNGSAGIVCVVDTEGADLVDHLGKLRAGRDAVLPDYPAAVGVAHPCVESWLLADPKAIARAMNLGQLPSVPDRPEELPAPRLDRRGNPKIVLADCAGVAGAVASQKTSEIAEQVRDLAAIRARCPASFGPFAEEVESRIRPLFGPPATTGPA